MKLIPVLGIPHYNRPDLLGRCIESINYPVEKLVIVLQGPEDKEFIVSMGKPGTPVNLLSRGGENKTLCHIPDLVKDAVFIRHPNAGVAGAWNEIIKLFPGGSATGQHWWLISNNDIEFAPGDLERMAHFAGTHLHAQVPGMFYGNHGASWFGITADCVAKAGLFDENIFPAYLEDCDYSRRCDLLGIPRHTVPDCQSIHGDGTLTGSCTVNSDKLLQFHNGRTHGNNFKYYRAKWGGDNEQEIYATPFNDPHWPVWAWKFDPAIRATNQWK